MTDRYDKCCLVLEGGGVKCAYQYGVLKTLVDEFGSVQEAVETLCADIEPENGDVLRGGAVFTGVAGSSFGALNSAMLLAGGMDKLEEFWENISAERIFHEPRLQTVMDKIYRRQKVFDLQTVLFALSSGTDVFGKQKEISELYYDFIVKNVDEDAVRECGLDLGVTAVELADFGTESEPRIKLPLPIPIPQEELGLLPNYSKIAAKRLREYFLEDIPEGLLPEYVSASAAFPAFRPRLIGDRYYTDGGVLDNIPIKMMEKRGCRRALCIRTGVNPPKKRWSDAAAVRFITPSRALGAAAVFSVENVHEMIALGEYDASNALKSL